MPAAFLSNTAACDSEMLRQSILRHIRYTLARPESDLTARELFKPVSLTIRDLLIDRMLETEERYNQQSVKRLYYL